MKTPEDVTVVRGLLASYVQWLFDSYPDESEDLGSYYSPERLQQALDDVATEFFPPLGIALIARIADLPVGCVLATRLEPGVAEMKRLFVRPTARGKGVGRHLIAGLIAKMAAAGQPTIRLDTAVFLTEAIALYRRMGFVEIDAYTALPAGTEKTALFMELRR